MNNKPVSIPSLGNSANEVMLNALGYECAGFTLKFKVVGEGEWYFCNLLGEFVKVKWLGNVPVTERVERHTFDSWLLSQIRKGFVGIFVESTGRNPHYSKELHRATGKTCL